MNSTIKEVRSWGNSGGILLPREWLGQQVRIELIDRSQDIKKEALDILWEGLNDILGIYLVGSYARGEQEKDSDIDILAVSKNTRKKIISGRYSLEIIPLKTILQLIKEDPIQILPRIREAKPLLNQALLEELKEIPLSSYSWKKFIEQSKQAITSSNELIECDKKGKNLLTSNSVIYSTLLRLRGVYAIQRINAHQEYSKKEFEKWTIKQAHLSQEEFQKAYTLYKQVRDGKSSEENLPISIAEHLLSLLEREVKKLEKKKETQKRN